MEIIVKAGTPIDRHAKNNTTSVYTGVKTFPMLPEKLSTDLTSLTEGEPRLSLVTEMTLDAKGRVVESDLYRATVRNAAKLAYDSIATWLDGRGPLPTAAAKIKGLDGQLRLQDECAQKMRRLRHELGALDLEVIETRPVVQENVVVSLAHDKKNRARELIEDFMIGANGVAANFLSRRKYPSIRRVVRVPDRWDRIVHIAEGLGDTLPRDADARALSDFLSHRRAVDPLRFPDLSLTVVKLLGMGEYVLEMPGVTSAGHFGLAVRDYTHSTAPNRRYPDIITHRLLKAALRGQPPTYSREELAELAKHCTEQENAADKVERQVRKSAAALFLSTHIGETFDSIVTGASQKGTWVRIFQPPVEGKVIHGFHDLDVGDRVHVKLMGVDVERGFIDFARH